MCIKFNYDQGVFVLSGASLDPAFQNGYNGATMTQGQPHPALGRKDGAMCGMWKSRSALGTPRIIQHNLTLLSKQS